MYKVLKPKYANNGQERTREINKNIIRKPLNKDYFSKTAQDKLKKKF